jgi:hypothetical protein
VLPASLPFGSSRDSFGCQNALTSVVMVFNMIVVIAGHQEDLL